ncbi:hypothetical protein N2152v2_009148 [Parachlorella kessleri]
MLGGERDDNSLPQLSLHSLLQGSRPRAQPVSRGRGRGRGKPNPLYATAAPAKEVSKSRSLPTSPVSKKGAPKPSNSTKQLRGITSRSTSFQALPGFGSEVSSKAQQGFSLKVFSKVDNLVFPCKSEPCSPERQPTAASSLNAAAFSHSSPCQLDLSALCLASAPSSPAQEQQQEQEQQRSSSDGGSRPASPVLLSQGSNPRSALWELRQLVQGQQSQQQLGHKAQKQPQKQAQQHQQQAKTPQAEDLQGEQGEATVPDSQRSPGSSCNEPELQGQLVSCEVTPAAPSRKEQASAWDLPGSLPPSPLPGLSPMQISPFPWVAEQPPAQDLLASSRSLPSSMVPSPPCSAQISHLAGLSPSPHLRSGQQHCEQHGRGMPAPCDLPRWLEGCDNPLHTTSCQSSFVGRDSCGAAGQHPQCDPDWMEQELHQEPRCQPRLDQGHCGGSGIPERPATSSSSPAEVHMEEAACDQAPSQATGAQERTDGEEATEPPQQRRQRHHVDGHIPTSRGAGAEAQAQQQQGEPGHEQAWPLLQHQEQQQQQQQRIHHLNQQQQQQQGQLCQHQQGAFDAHGRQQELALRRTAEDAAVDSTCPPELRHVLRPFPTQKEAFAFADRCNSSQPLLRQTSLLISRLAPRSEPACHSEPTGPQQQRNVPTARAQQPPTPLPGQHQQQQCPQQRLQQQVGAPADPQLLAGAARCGQPGKIDFLSRYTAGLAVPTGSQGYHTTFSGQAVDARGTDEKAKWEARELYLEALQAFRPPPAQPAALVDDVVSGMRRAHSSSVDPRHGLQQGNSMGAPGGVRQTAGAPGVDPSRLPSSWATSSGDAARVAAPGEAGSVLPAAEEEQQAAQLHEEPIRVFCLEKQGRNGVFYRQFVAASYPTVWREYRRTPTANRHWYEVVREGRPCHLYFDLECPAPCNPDLDMDTCINCLLHHVDEALGQHFGLAVDYNNVFELDSSTDAKLSRHLHIRIPGHAFVNNHAMGKFVSQVVASAGQQLMAVRSVEGGVWEWGSIIDTAVNRHFRMVWNCKGGKGAVLEPTRRFATQEGCTKTAADVFLDTLICRVDPSNVLLQMPDPLPPRPLSGHAGAPANSGETGAWGTRIAWKHDAYDGSLTPEQATELKQLAERTVPFIEQVATQRAGGQPARARTLAFCGYQGTVAYSMIGPGSHYCENIGRLHQSNHVFFVVNFTIGMFAQKCHDPDCCHFRLAKEGRESGIDSDQIDGLLTGLLRLQTELKSTSVEGALDEALKDVLRQLEAATEALQAVVDKYTPPDVYQPPVPGDEEWARRVITYAHKLSYTTFAPVGFVPGQTALRHFKPPAPQDFQLRSSLLHQFQRDYEARQQQAQQAAANIAAAAAASSALTTGTAAAGAGAAPPPLSMEDILKTMPAGWRPGAPSAAAAAAATPAGAAAGAAGAAQQAPEQQALSSEEEEDEGPAMPAIQRPALLSAALNLALSPDMEIEFGGGSSDDEDDSDDESA